MELTPEDFRAAWPSVVRTLVTVTGSLDDAEEFAAEAFSRAAAYPGEIGSVGAWCVAAGRRAWIDDVRRRVVHEKSVAILGADARTGIGEGDGSQMYAPDLDDRVALLFVACDDALPESGRLVLALRLVCGLPTIAIADLLGIEPAAAAARLTRAKKALGAARPGFVLADDAARRRRLPSVLSCLSAMFTHGQRVGLEPRDARSDTAAQALAITDALVALYPADTEVLGLRAVLLLGLGRRPGRIGDDGVARPAAEVDRTRWDRDLIGRGLADATAAARIPGRFALEAAISGLHSAPTTFEDTDWVQIVRLQCELERRWPAPSVTVARLIAESYADADTARVEADLQTLAEGGPAYAARDAVFALADIEWRSGRRTMAAQRYRELAELGLPEPVRRFCVARAAPG